MQESRRWRISPTLLIKLLDSMAYIQDDNSFSNTLPLIYPTFITGRKTFCQWQSLPGKHMEKKRICDSEDSCILKRKRKWLNCPPLVPFPKLTNQMSHWGRGEDPECDSQAVIPPGNVSRKSISSTNTAAPALMRLTIFP